MTSLTPQSKIQNKIAKLTAKLATLHVSPPKHVDMKVPWHATRHVGKGMGKGKEHKKVFLSSKHQNMIQALKPTMVRRKQLKAKLSMIKDGYFDAKDMKDQKEDPKNMQAELDIIEREIAAAKAALSAAYGTKPIHMRLWYTAATAGSTNTAITTVVTLDPNSSAELASLVNLFDLMIVDGAEVNNAVYSTAGTSQTNTWSIAYDPSNSAVYTTVVAPLPAAYHLGPIRSTTSGYRPDGGFIISGAQPVNKSGYYKWHVKIPEQPENNNTNDTAVYTGCWTDTANATTIYGYLKPYISAAGSGNSYQIEYVIGLDMRFKMRT